MPLSVAILGASGFAGATLVSLLASHPFVSLAFLGSRSHQRKPLHDLYPPLGHVLLPKLQHPDELFSIAPSLDAVFCCLPHEETPPIVSKLFALQPQIQIIDFSAAFRIKDPVIYQQYYHHPLEKTLADQAVYGLCEIHRNAIARAKLIANPGCYTTTCLLPLIPLLESASIEPDDIIIDAKSGISGAGNRSESAYSFCRINESFKAYSLEGHRHEPEIQQELQRTVQKSGGTKTPSFLFSPHLIPMSRGILATIYVNSNGNSFDLWQKLLHYYEKEPFVRILPHGEIPSTEHACHSNVCIIGVVKRSVGKRHTIVSVTDNLIKGAAGQALQNLNIMKNLPETTGLNLPSPPL